MGATAEASDRDLSWIVESAADGDEVAYDEMLQICLSISRDQSIDSSIAL